MKVYTAKVSHCVFKFTCMSVCLLCLCLASVLLISGCHPQGDAPDGTETEVGTVFPTTDTLPVTEAEVTLPTPATHTVTEPATEALTLEPDTTPTDPRPGDPSAYAGLLISMVYGTGKNNPDAAISHGFVQLYNETDSEIRLSGASLYYKTDSAGAFSQFVFPADATVKPYGYYLVRANSPAGSAPEHTVMTVDRYDAAWDVFLDNKEVRLVLAPAGWLLSPDEDVLKLRDAVSVFLATQSYCNSVFAVDSLSKNKVAVRTALKGYSGFHTENVTAMTYNDLMGLRPTTADGRICDTVRSRLSEVRFSFPAGVYDEPVLLDLSAAEGYTVWYTLDGSDPSMSDTRQLYTGSIYLSETDAVSWGNTIKEWARVHSGARPTQSKLPGAHVVRAYAENGTETTAVFTNTYFIDPFMSSQGLTVMSLSIPLNEMLGSNGFYSNYIPAGHTITDRRPRGLATMEVFDPNGSRVGRSHVELAVSGNGSSGWGMKSLRIYYKNANNLDGGMEKDLNYDLFDGRAVNANGEAITNFSRLLLRNSGNDCGNSYIRDAYMQATAQGLAVDHMASASTLVFINGEFWGIYNIRERYSPEYVSSHYGVLKENVALIESDYSQVHTNPHAPYVVSSGLADDADSFNDLYQFLYRNRDNMVDSANYAYVCERMDIDSFIDSFVVRIFYSSDDWPNNNIKVWRNRDPNDPSGMDTKWHFTLLDLDMGIGWSDRNNYNAEGNNFFGKMDGGSICGDMMVYLMRNPDFKNRFICRFYEAVKETLTTEKMTAILDRFVNERNDLMYLQVARWSECCGINTWNSAVSVMRRFCERRQDIVLNQLYGRYGVSESNILAMSRKQITMSFDDARTEVTYNGVLQEAGEVHDIGKQPVTFTVSAKAKPGYILKAVIWSPVGGSAIRIDAQEGCTAMTETFTADVSGTVTVICRAENTDPVAGVGGTLVAGPTYVFYLDKNGDLYGWGDNRYGVLGIDPAQAYITVPTLVMRNVAKVATTSSTTYEGGETNFTTAIVTRDGKLYTVGVNNCGQLGRNGTTNDPYLGQVNIGRRIADVAVGNDHTLIVDTDGNMMGVGHNNYGQLGTGTGEVVTAWKQIETGVISVSAGRRCTTLIKTDGHLYGLGDNRWEKLVDRAPDRLNTPTLMQRNVAFTASGQHQCIAVGLDGTLYYAGWRPFDSFTKGNGNEPTMVKVMDGVLEASLQIDNMVILCENGDVYGYGLNTGNALGKVMTGGRPALITTDCVSAVAGYGFTAFLYRDGTICVQGANDYGQAGNGQVGGSVGMAEVIR